MSIPSQRHLFDIPDDIFYLNCAFWSPFLKEAREAGIRGIDKKLSPWERGSQEFFDEAEEARQLFAETVGALTDAVAIIPSASYGLTIASENLPIQKGQKIVLLEEQFPSNVYPWREKAKQSGAVIETLPRPKDLDWTTVLWNAIDEQTAVVTVPHGHWMDGN